MRKILLTVMIAVMLAVTSVCFASSDGSELDAQEKIVDIFLNGKYTAIKPYMTTEYQKILDEKAYTEAFASMGKDLGKLQDKEMLIYQKIKDGGVLRYASQFEKVKVIEIVAVFKMTNGKPQLYDCKVFQPQMNQPAQGKGQQK